MDDCVEVEEERDDIEMGRILGKASVGSFKFRLVDARCCISVLVRDSIMLFGMEVGT